MTTARTHASPPSLHHITFDETIRPVISDLAALSLSNPTDHDYAEFIRNPPSLVAIAERCTQRMMELERFIELAEMSAPYMVKAHLGIPYGIAMLNEDATLALALLPARTPADHHARREHGLALLRAVQDSDDPALPKISRLVFGIEHLSLSTAGAVATNALAHAVSRYCELAASRSAATSHRLEDAATLRAFVVRAPDFDALYREVEVHATAAARLAAIAGDSSLDRRDDVKAALEGARMQATIALLRIAVSPAHTDTARWSKLANRVIPDPAPGLASTLTLATKMSESLRIMLATHPLT